MKKFAKMLTKVHFVETDSYRELYKSIDANLAYLDESLIYHYASSAYSGSATSTLYMMVDKYFPDKNEYQSFLSHLLTNIPNIESADILSRLQDLASVMKQQEPKTVDFSAEELLAYIRNNAEINAKYQEFLERHGHRCIKEAEMRNKPWREDEISLMNYLSSIIKSPMSLVQKEEKIDYRKEFAFIKNPLLKAASINYAKKCRQGVVDRESTKSQLIKLIDLFKTQYVRLAELLVADHLLSDADLIYFLTHDEIGKLIAGDPSLLPLSERRRKAYAIQEELSFDDTYIGKPIADVFDVEQSDGVLKGVPVSNGEGEGVVHVVYSADDGIVGRPADVGETRHHDFALLQGVCIVHRIDDMHHPFALSIGNGNAFQHTIALLHIKNIRDRLSKKGRSRLRKNDTFFDVLGRKAQKKPQLSGCGFCFSAVKLYSCASSALA